MDTSHIQPPATGTAYGRQQPSYDTELTEAGQFFGDLMIAVMVATGVVAVVFAYYVYRRSGFVGILARK